MNFLSNAWVTVNQVITHKPTPNQNSGYIMEQTQRKHIQRNQRGYRHPYNLTK